MCFIKHSMQLYFKVTFSFGFFIVKCGLKGSISVSICDLVIQQQMSIALHFIAIQLDEVGKEIVDIINSSLCQVVQKGLGATCVKCLQQFSGVMQIQYQNIAKPSYRSLPVTKLQKEKKNGSPGHCWKKGKLCCFLKNKSQGWS